MDSNMGAKQQQPGLQLDFKNIECSGECVCKY